jgi:hypothetical protein
MLRAEHHSSRRASLLRSSVLLHRACLTPSVSLPRASCFVPSVIPHAERPSSRRASFCTERHVSCQRYSSRRASFLTSSILLHRASFYAERPPSCRAPHAERPSTSRVLRHRASFFVPSVIQHAERHSSRQASVYIVRPSSRHVLCCTQSFVSPRLLPRSGYDHAFERNGLFPSSVCLPASRSLKHTDWSPSIVPSVFVLSYSHVIYLDYGGALFDRFPAAVRAVAARCKLSCAVRPGLSHENNDRTKERTNERTKENGPRSHSHSCSADAMKAGVGRNKGSSTSAPSSSASTLLSSSRSLRSGSSHSTAHSVHPPQPGPGLALLHPWWRGSLVPPYCISRPLAGLVTSSDSSTSPSLS